MDKTPIFPLNTIVFPGGYLPLRIFEPRYLEMVKSCLKENSGFGIVLSNNESHYSIGTYCKIVDWEQLPDGLLGILTRGKYRFKINNSSIKDDGLLVSDISSIDEPEDQEIPKELMPYSNFLKRVLDEYPKFYHEDAPTYYKDSQWVGSRLAEILPMSSSEKQVILETEDYLVRLYKVKDFIDSKKTNINVL